MTQITTSNGRYYEWQGKKYPSVTTILSKGIPKPGLVPWASKMVATGAVEDIEIWAGMSDEEAISYLSGLPNAKRNTSANLGSIIHAATESHSLDREHKEISEEARQYVDSFQQFTADWSPKFLFTEQAVFNDTHGYAGTLDSLVRIGRTVWVLDTKTGKRVYPEVALQLAAYANAEFVGKPDGTEVAMPVVKKGGVVHLTPEGYSFIPVRIDEEVFDAFLSVKDIFHWGWGLSGTVLRDPLVKK